MKSSLRDCRVTQYLGPPGPSSGSRGRIVNGNLHSELERLEDKRGPSIIGGVYQQHSKVSRHDGIHGRGL